VATPGADQAAGKDGHRLGSTTGTDPKAQLGRAVAGAESIEGKAS
jgi:hypothetical protein